MDTERTLPNPLEQPVVERAESKPVLKPFERADAEAIRAALTAPGGSFAVPNGLLLYTHSGRFPAVFKNFEPGTFTLPEKIDNLTFAQLQMVAPELKTKGYGETSMEDPVGWYQWEIGEPAAEPVIEKASEQATAQAEVAVDEASAEAQVKDVIKAAAPTEPTPAQPQPTQPAAPLTPSQRLDEVTDRAYGGIAPWDLEATLLKEKENRNS